MRRDEADDWGDMLECSEVLLDDDLTQEERQALDRTPT